MRLLPDGSIEFDPSELQAVLLAKAQMAAAATPQPVPVAPRQTPTAATVASRATIATTVATDATDTQGLAAQVATHFAPKPFTLALLRHIKIHGTITMVDLVAALTKDGVTADAATISGSISGLTKFAGKLGIDRAEIVVSERDEQGMMHYSAGPILVAIDPGSLTA
jgi:hypothetical protein